MTAAGVAAHATFRFYEELNDFLPPDRRRRAAEVRCAQGASVKHAIEAQGVPHTEVELILANGESVGFDYRVRTGDVISVYPRFESFDVSALVKVRSRPLREPRFIADAQLGGLARLLCMLGFDTTYENDLGDERIRTAAQAEQRIILTRDRELLKCRNVTHGCPARVVELHDRFCWCEGCDRVYWEGSHWQRMGELVRDLSAAAR